MDPPLDAGATLLFPGIREMRLPHGHRLSGEGTDERIERVVVLCAPITDVAV
jgi:hypothetical protein